MIRLFSIFLSLVFALALVGCSGSATHDNTNASDQSVPYTAAEFSDANVALAEGTKLLDSGDTDRAIIVLNRAVELNPDLAEAYFKLGIAYALVETRDAAVVGEQITPTPLPGEKRPKTIKTNSEKAFEKAVAAYKKLIDANPDDHVAYFNLGRAYNKLNEDEDAAKAYKQAVKLKPEDTEYQTDLGAILIKLAQYREAIAPLKKAIELDPENSRAIDLLDDAEAGRKRIDFVQEKKDENRVSNSNSNANSNTNTSVPSNITKPKPTETKQIKPPPANKPN
jgi:tetratricopeptide (TPR) repeat protein